MSTPKKALCVLLSVVLVFGLSAFGRAPARAYANDLSAAGLTLEDEAAATYNVTVASGIENGTVKVDKSTASAKDKPVITATPADRYHVDSFNVAKSNDSPVLVTRTSATTGTFTMPADNVTVSASFAADATFVDKGTYKVTATPSSTMVKVLAGEEYAPTLADNGDGTSTLTIYTTSSPDYSVYKSPQMGAPYYDAMRVMLDDYSDSAREKAVKVTGEPVYGTVAKDKNGRDCAAASYVGGKTKLNFYYHDGNGYVIGYKFVIELDSSASDLYNKKHTVYFDQKYSSRYVNSQRSADNQGKWTSSKYTLDISPVELLSYPLSITNEESMFKAVSASLSHDAVASKDYLVMALSASSYTKMFPGTLPEYNSNTDTSKVIDFKLNEDGKHEFAIPVTLPTSEDTFTVSLVAITGKGSTVRRADIDLKNKKVTVGNFKGKVDSIAVTDDLDANINPSASLEVYGYPYAALSGGCYTSNNFEPTLTIKFADGKATFDKARIATHAYDGSSYPDYATYSAEIAVGEDGTLVLPIKNVYKKTAQIIDGKTAKIQLHNASTGEWVDRMLVLDTQLTKVDAKATDANKLIITGLANLDAATVTLDASSFTYDGKAKEPVPTVKIGDTTLPKDSYVVSYADNTDVGTASVTVSAKSDSTQYAGSKTVEFAIAKANASIDAADVSKTYGDAAFPLGAKLTKGDGTLKYASSNPKVATVAANGTVTITGAGEATITVSADATGNFNAASKSVKVTVAKANASITAADVSKTYGDAAFALGAKLAKGDGTLKYASSNPKVATVAANGTVTITGAGEATITVSADATGNFNAASKAVKVTVAQASQVLSAKKAVSKTFGDKAFALGAKLTKGDGTLTYRSSNSKVATVSKAGKVTVKGAGTAKITVSAAKTANYKAAFATVTVTVAKAKQAISAKASVKPAKALKANKKTKKLAKNATIDVKKLAKVSAKTTVKYAKVGKTGGKSISVNAKTGKITVKKGLKAGTYTVKVKLTAAANANYKAAKAKTIQVKITVKK